MPLFASVDPLLRFRAKYEVTPGGCWSWTASLDEDGYGTFWWEGRTGRAHRFAYESHIGPISDDLELDHRCLNRSCVNPDHVQPVTSQVNQLRGNGVSGINARKVACDHGHPFDSANTYITPNGRRNCRTCRDAATRRHQARRGGQNLAAA